MSPRRTWERGFFAVLAVPAAGQLGFDQPLNQPVRAQDRKARSQNFLLKLVPKLEGLREVECAGCAPSDRLIAPGVLPGESPVSSAGLASLIILKEQVPQP